MTLQICNLCGLHITIYYYSFWCNHNPKHHVPIGTFDLQEVEIKSVSNRKVCLTCVFTRGSIGNGCVIKLHLNTDEIFELITSAKKHNLAINECYDVSNFNSNHSYYWEAFASKNGLELSSRPAFTGNLTIQQIKS